MRALRPGLSARTPFGAVALFGAGTSILYFGTARGPLGLGPSGSSHRSLR